MTTPVQFIPNKISESQAWIEWHKMMKRRYGLKKANKLFVKTWGKRAGAGSSASTNDLRTYMAKNKVMLDTSTLESITDTTFSTLDSIGNIFTMGKYATIGLGVILIGGVGMMVYNIAKQPVKAAGAALKLTPVGKVGTISKLLK